MPCCVPACSSHVSPPHSAPFGSEGMMLNILSNSEAVEMDGGCPKAYAYSIIVAQIATKKIQRDTFGWFLGQSLIMPCIVN